MKSRVLRQVTAACAALLMAMAAAEGVAAQQAAGQAPPTPPATDPATPAPPAASQPGVAAPPAASQSGIAAPPAASQSGIAAPPAASQPAAAAPKARDPVTAAQQQFMELFKAGQYDAALPQGREALRLAEALGEDDPRLITALVNLGTVQLRLGDLTGAETSYRRALDIAQENHGIASPRLVTPLTGLGTVYAAQARHDRAIEMLQQALAVSRRADGLFNLSQLDILEALVRSLFAVGDYAGVESQRLYAVRVVQQRYGASDPRTLPMLEALAQWYETSGQYEQERAAYREVLAISRKVGGGRNEASVLALIGIARGHRLQFAYDPGSMTDQVDAVVTPDGRIESRALGAGGVMQPAEMAPQVRLDKEGEQALLGALQVLDSVKNPPTRLKVRALIELGDWYMTAKKPDLAIPRYRQAWPLLPASLVRDEVNPLLAPRQLLYRQPQGAQQYRDRRRDEVIEHTIEHSFTVTARGDLTGIKLVASDADSSSRETRTQRALEDAIYSPRFENGEPVATTDVHSRQTFYDIKPQPAPEKKDKPAKKEPK